MNTTVQVNGLELRGAYGRETNMDDWRNGLDFKITGGPYCSNRDIQEMLDEGFHMLEFVKHDGTFVERIILDDTLSMIVENMPGSFTRL